MLTASCHCGAIQRRIARAPRTLTECSCSLYLHEPERIAGLPIRPLDGAQSWQVLGERRQPELFRPHGG